MNTNRQNASANGAGVNGARLGRSRKAAEAEFADPLEMSLDQALGNFRASVRAWSEAELSRPRTVTPAVRRHSWRFATGWALGCVVAAGSLTAGVFEHHRNEALARMAYERQIQIQVDDQQADAPQSQASQAAVREKAGEGDQNLMAEVDSDVSRQVPSAMEPLAQLMDEGGTQ